MKISARCLVLALGVLASGNAFARNHILVNDALGSIMGIQNIEYSYKATEKLTIGIVGISASHVKRNGMELNGESVGAVARYYFDSAFVRDSWYLSAVASKTNLEASVISNGIRYAGKSANHIAVGGGITGSGIVLTRVWAFRFQQKWALLSVTFQETPIRMNSNLISASNSKWAAASELDIKDDS